ncbi:hypothetical protein D3C81_1341080 [compost metagenome]
MAHPAAGVLRLGHRHAAHVSHGLHREPQPALAGQRQLGLAAVPAADEPGRAFDPLGGLEDGRQHQPGILHPGPGDRRQQPGAGTTRLCGWAVSLQRLDHRYHPRPLGHGPEPPGAAALPATGRGQYLSLAEMDPPRLDRRDHRRRLRLLPDPAEPARPGQPRHRRLCRHPAVPAGRTFGTVLADRQPPRLHRRFAGRDPGVDGDHVAATGGQPAGFLHPVAEHDLCARRHQLAHGGHCLAGGQRVAVHPDFAVHQRQQ